MSKKLDPKRKYEESGKRPGTPVSTRLTDEELRGVDDARGDDSRAAWLHRIIREKLRLNTPPPKRRKK